MSVQCGVSCVALGPNLHYYHLRVYVLSTASSIFTSQISTVKATSGNARYPARARIFPNSMSRTGKVAGIDGLTDIERNHFYPSRTTRSTYIKRSKMILRLQEYIQHTPQSYSAGAPGTRRDAPQWATSTLIREFNCSFLSPVWEDRDIV